MFVYVGREGNVVADKMRLIVAEQKMGDSREIVFFAYAFNSFDPKKNNEER